MQKQDHPLSQIKKVYELMLRENLSELQWENKRTRIFLRRFQKKREPEENKIESQSLLPGGKAARVEENIQSITSPIAGIFYVAPSPGAPPFVNTGEVIRPGQTVCIVEAMKMMNEIQADRQYRVLEVLVRDREHVQIGQKLFSVVPV